MIRHCVFLDLKSGYQSDDLQEILSGLEALSVKLSNVSSFVAGPNQDFEKKSQRYGWGFTIDFLNREALAAYANDPEHQSLGKRLCALCNGEAQGVVVFDLEMASATAAT